MAAIAPCSREQHNVPEPVAAPAADSAIAAWAASTAKNLGLRVCGVELSSLLSDQLAAEAENHRVVKAFGVMNASVTVLTPSVLDLILKIKQPPSVLAKVLEAAMIVVLPSDATPRPASLAGIGGSAWRAFGLTGEQLASHIRAVDVDAVSDDQLAALVPYYNEITHKDAEDVNQFCRHLWAWVSAVGVICGVPEAVLIGEDSAARRLTTLEGASKIKLRSRSCNGAPVTGRPSYVSTLSHSDGETSTEAVLGGAASTVAEERVTRPANAQQLAQAALEPQPRRPTHSSATRRPSTPLTLDALHPLKFLGAGAFANVFMCQHRSTGQVMALKCILKSVVLRKKKQKQVIAEKLALSCAPHPNIIRLYASFSDDQHLYFAMELALGGEVFALIEEIDPLPEAAVRYYIASVTLALSHLHENGFIYRDLKPENILLDSGGRLKLCDLGLCKKAERAWTVVGTPQYLAPEVLRGEGATCASDWWALGILCFEMFTGELPFVAPDDSDDLLFELIIRGIFSWSRPTRGGARTNARERVSYAARDLVSGLIRLTVPPSPEAAPYINRNAPCAPPLASPRRTLSRSQIGPLRMGASSRGASEIKEHKWFKDFDFEALMAGRMAAPFKPNLRGSRDDGNFGPIDWRGKPVVSSPDYDTSLWDAQWDAAEGSW